MATATCSIGRIEPHHAKALWVILSAFAEVPTITITCDRCNRPMMVRAVNGSEPFFQHLFGVNYFCRFGATILAGSARRHGRPGRPPSRPGRKAHNCNLSGGTDGVSPDRAGALAEDARSALTRRPARSYAVRSREQEGRSNTGRPGVHEVDRRRARGRSGPGARPREAGAGGDFRRDRSMR